MNLHESRDGLSARAELDAASASLSIEDRDHEWRAAIQLQGDDLVGLLALLAWAEATATSLAAATAAKPLLLCLDDPSAGPVREAAAACGFSLAVSEEEMRRSTAGVLPVSIPPGLVSLPWTEGTAPLFHHAYFESFRERPGFPGWEEARWRSTFASGESFRPDLSRVILDGPEPTAFAVLWLEDGLGWVTQMGVRPPWRGKGLGEFFLQHALAAFAAESIETVSLEVATNNPAARALYERVGFTVTASHQSWRKSVEHPSRHEVARR